MRVLFLGGFFHKEMESDILAKSKGLVHYAANKLQWNLIDGLLSIDNIKLNLISAPFIGSYPKDYMNLFFGQYRYNYSNSMIDCKYVKFCNLWGYKNISRKRTLKREIKSFVEDKNTQKVIIVYSTHTPFLQAAVYAKRKDPSIHICLIVPDLPQYMNLNDKKTLAYTILKYYDIKFFKKECKHVDSFVLLTDYMKDILEVKDRPYVVVEGVVSVTDIEKFNSANTNNDEKKLIVYTGTLNRKFGIVNLVQAFSKIPNTDIELKICGRGDSEQLIKEYSAKDPRIKYLGQLSNDEAVKLQRSATILVNPRPDNEDFTKYSYPSKNMEYLLTGNSVIAYKLKGIPNEYDDYIYYVEDDSVEGLRNKICEVINLPNQDRFEKGKKAREFVISEKNNIESSKKIYNMIKNN